MLGSSDEETLHDWLEQFLVGGSSQVAEKVAGNLVEAVPHAGRALGAGLPITSGQVQGAATKAARNSVFQRATTRNPPEVLS